MLREKKLENRNNLLLSFCRTFFLPPSPHPRKDPLGKWLRDGIQLSKIADTLVLAARLRIKLRRGNEKAASFEAARVSREGLPLPLE